MRSTASMATATGPAGEPVAIIGYSCRFPGAADPERYWELLAAGRSSVGPMPASRARLIGDGLDAQAGTAAFGAFIEGVDRFDPAPFGISPREAAAMDPQQRLMLELSWEALEDARIGPASLRGCAAGVFAGSMTSDYGSLVDTAGPGGVRHHTFTGLARSLIANRVSFALGLRGPSLVIDAGQASSLVAVHLAIQALRGGECELALAGAVELNLAPQGALIAERFGGLSPDGRCYTFDARANGYVRGEGAGLVVLKTLARALADGDLIRAVIVGGAVNNDGGGPSLTVPDEAAQRELLGRACRLAGVDPADVQYVELHGTGTRAGDPVEARALAAVYGTARTPGDPLPVGSAKTNIGHLGAAAGMAGLLKVVAAIEHGVLPASLNFTASGPDLPLAELNLRVQQSAGPWPRPDAPALAGVSSFSVGGTNCHLLVGPAPAGQHRWRPAGADGHRPRFTAGLIPLPVSGASRAAVRAQAARLHAYAARHPELRAADIGLSLATTRSALAHRAVLLAGSDSQMRGELAALAAGDETAAQVVGVAAERGKVVFVFPGQGSQWPGMAADLLRCSAVFRLSIDACERALSPRVGWSLTDVLCGADGAPPLDRVDVVQPVLFAIMVSLAALWRSFGVEPAAVTGQSQGEVAAACVAGALSLADAATIVAERSKILRSMAGTGAMASVEMPPSELAARLASQAGNGGRAAPGIAVVNGPRSVVVSGQPEAVASLVASCKAEGVRAHLLPVDYASHSPQMEEVRSRLMAALAPVRPRPLKIPFISSVTGQPAGTGSLDAGYWYRNLREPADVAAAVRALADHDAFIEISPHPVVTMAVQQTLEEVGSAAVVRETLRKDAAGPRSFLTALAGLHASGGTVDWRPAFGADAAVVSLPTYPFQRRRCWLDDSGEAPAGPADGETATWRERVAGLGAEAAARELGELVTGHAAAVLGHDDRAAIEPARSFADLGFDSVTALELRNRLAGATGLALRTTAVYDFPTAERLAAHLAAELSASPAAASSARAGGSAPERGEPLAIVSVACRFPGGVRSAPELWQLARDGRDAMTGFPANRGWDLKALRGPDQRAPGTSVAWRGGFLPDADVFDAAFFGISPREATAMDPQQRILLELAWEAIERAGIAPSELRGSRCGVFVGAMPAEYGPRMHQAPDGLGGYLLTGTTTSVLSGRIAYVLGLEGPAVTVDTACSSSLVALHLAAGALRRGECDLALVAGVSIMSSPGLFTEFSRQHGLAPDGRCKPFSAAADGTAWSEGAGVLLLEPFAAAKRNERWVHALIRGSAVNSDGASNGLTAPNGPSQERVINAALADAGLAPPDVDAVEAHGTGTALGDPIEARALIATYGKDRPADRPLLLGSVKSHIGHTQAAAGIAGVIMMIEGLGHSELPPISHLGEPSPHVDWPAAAVIPLADPQEWPRPGRPLRAGVSSFGISGTNAHVIIEQPPGGPAGPDGHAQARRRPAAVPWPVTAADDDALRAQARRLADGAGPGTADSADVGYSLAATRALLAHRAVTIGPDTASHTAALAAFADGALSEPSAVTGVAGRYRPLAFMFTGQGSQQAGTGRELYEDYPVFADAVDELCAEFDAVLDGPALADVMFAAAGTPQADRLADTGWAQPAIFTLQVALHRLIRSFGPRPDYVIGHSVGELTAACVAGVLTVPDAVTLVAARARLMQRQPRTGAMVALTATEAEVLPLLDGLDADVAIAAVNGPSSVVISGTAELVDRVADRCVAAGRKARRLRVSHAFHSPHTDAVLDEFRSIAASVRYRPPSIPVIDAASGAVAAAADLASPGYWAGHIRSAVRFGDGIARLASLGVASYLELGPDAVLAPLARACLAGADGPPGDRRAAAGPGHDRPELVAATLRAGRPEAAEFLGAMARQFVRGASIDWRAAFNGYQVSKVPLPTYPFQGRRYWLDPAAEVSGAARASTAAEVSGAARASTAAEVSGAAREDTTVPAGYRLSWEPVTDAVRSPLPSRLAVTGTLAAELAAPACGASVVIERHADLGAAQAALAAEGVADPVPVLLACGPGEQPGGSDRTVPAEALRRAGDALEAIKLWLGHDRKDRQPLVLLTCGAVAASANEDITDLAGAAVWGLVRGAATEHPGQLMIIDLDGQAASAAALPRAIASAEPQLAIRAGKLLAPRIGLAGPATASQAADLPRPHRAGLDPAGTVLILGGTGALGALTARRLVTEHGVRHLLLAARSGGDAPGAAGLGADLAELGAQVTVAACDAADYGQLARLLAAIPAGHPLTAVIHAAGVLRDGQLASLTAGGLREVFRPKVDAAWNLHLLTRDAGLAALVLYSSVVGLVGNPGQAAYAAANAFLDALAQHRHIAGLPAASLAWGPWAQAGGMAAGLGKAAERRMAASGIAPLPADEALRLFDAGLTAAEPLLITARFDVSALRPDPGTSMLSALNGSGGPPAGQQPAGLADATQQLTGLPEPEQRRRLLAVVCTHAAQVLGHDSADVIRPEQGFLDGEFDSLSLEELRVRLESETGVTFPETVIFDYPTPLALTEYLRTCLIPSATEPATGPPAGLADGSDEDIFDFIDNELGIA